MLINVLRAKLHLLTVTEANLDYVGSITIDEDLLDAASGGSPYGMAHGDYVNISNKSNAAFWRTYVIAGPRGSGVVCLNGPPARLFQPGDEIIVFAEALIEPDERLALDPLVVLVDKKNKVTEVRRLRESRG